MIRTISQRISNLEDVKVLTREKTEEAAKSIQIKLSASEKQ